MPIFVKVPDLDTELVIEGKEMLQDSGILVVYDEDDEVVAIFNEGEWGRARREEDLDIDQAEEALARLAASEVPARFRKPETVQLPESDVSEDVDED